MTLRGSKAVRGLAAGCVVIGAGLLAGCLRTHNDVVLSQQKPLEVNVNLKGKFTVVIQEQAQQGMDYIAGDTSRIPTITPPAAKPTKATTTTASAPGTSSLRWKGGTEPVLFADSGASMSIHQLFMRLRTDFPRVMSLLRRRLVGEAHTGYLTPRGSLTAAQAQFVNTENGFRKSLYKKLAQRNGISVAKEALAFYAARLRHLPHGVWVQLRAKGGGWVWVIWRGQS